MVGPRTQGAKIGVAAALAVLGFGASFGLARLTDDGGAANAPTQAEQASIAALPPEAARLVRLTPAGAVPALRAAPTTATPTPSPTRAPEPTPTTAAAPEPTPAPEPTTAPEPTPTTTAPPATTYIP